MVPSLSGLNDRQQEGYRRVEAVHYALQDENKALRHLLLDMNPSLTHSEIDRLINKS